MPSLPLFRFKMRINIERIFCVVLIVLSFCTEAFCSDVTIKVTPMHALGIVDGYEWTFQVMMRNCGKETIRLAKGIYGSPCVKNKRVYKAQLPLLNVMGDDIPILGSAELNIVELRPGECTMLIFCTNQEIHRGDSFILEIPEYFEKRYGVVSGRFAVDQF